LNELIRFLDDYTRIFIGIMYYNFLSRGPNPGIFVILGGRLDIPNQGSKRPGIDKASQHEGYTCPHRVKNGNKYPWASKKYIKLELVFTRDYSTP
jgi:hypothetical protein